MSFRKQLEKEQKTYRQQLEIFSNLFYGVSCFFLKYY